MSEENKEEEIRISDLEKWVLTKQGESFASRYWVQLFFGFVMLVILTLATLSRSDYKEQQTKTSAQMETLVTMVYDIKSSVSLIKNTYDMTTATSAREREENTKAISEIRGQINNMKNSQK